MKQRHFLRSTIIFLLMPVLLSSALLLGGCMDTASGSDFRGREFRARIRGNLFGVEICADAERTLRQDGSTLATLTYQAPASLEGVVLSVCPDCVTLTDQNGTREVAREEYRGLLLPLSVLVEELGAPLSHTKRGEERVLRYSFGEWVLGRDGMPRSFSSTSLCFSVEQYEIPGK